MSAKRPAALYISYDGMLEPLGQSHVIAYLEGLTDEFAFHLVSFEKLKDWADADRRAAVEHYSREAVRSQYLRILDKVSGIEREPAWGEKEPASA